MIPVFAPDDRLFQPLDVPVLELEVLLPLEAPVLDEEDDPVTEAVLPAAAVFVFAPFVAIVPTVIVVVPTGTSALS